MISSKPVSNGWMDDLLHWAVLWVSIEMASGLQMETFSPSRSLREHDSNGAIMKCFKRSVGKFRVVWGSYKSGLHLAWGRNPFINLLAADTVLLSPCPRCKAHLNAVALPFTCTCLKVLPSQHRFLLPRRSVAGRSSTHWCIWCFLSSCPAGLHLPLPTQNESRQHLASPGLPRRSSGSWYCEKPSFHAVRVANSFSKSMDQIRALQRGDQNISLLKQYVSTKYRSLDFSVAQTSFWVPRWQLLSTL